MYLDDDELKIVMTMLDLVAQDHWLELDEKDLRLRIQNYFDSKGSND